jgi:phosphosulfolactate phosphohydrolase-like enzyme
LRDRVEVSQYLTSRVTAAVALMPAGNFASGDVRVEDELCADALTQCLAGKDPDVAASAALIRADPRVRRRVEAEPGFAADLELSLESDPGAIVLKFNTTGVGVGRIVRA